MTNQKEIYYHKELSPQEIGDLIEANEEFLIQQERDQYCPVVAHRRREDIEEASMVNPTEYEGPYFNIPE